MEEISLNLNDEVLSSVKLKFEHYIKLDVPLKVIEIAEVAEPAWVNIKKTM
ncbi:MAG: hypothetical protein AB2L14_11845 [Candidatus Xenobiia bacterium LiM19]